MAPMVTSPSIRKYKRHCPESGVKYIFPGLEAGEGNLNPGYPYSPSLHREWKYLPFALPKVRRCFYHAA